MDKYMQKFRIQKVHRGLWSATLRSTPCYGFGKEAYVPFTGDDPVVTAHTRRRVIRVGRRLRDRLNRDAAVRIATTEDVR